ncbi:acyl carrier protein [Sporomusaceae bacterium BoRhaA]|uniref:acyl carrier protein n=1 Tax=Pelorhabdus rhamnosifermentans TaxID=2772457 RepID=UPI001C0602D3|nr:acyl carrier protein [Pelorhabdus rhamnosifermentans]MBU2699187.1 acyl carrier protein [Pelorhabdus rhamnosifermentans]
MEQQIYDLIIKVLADYNEQNEEQRISVEKGMDAPLYGLGGTLDSLGLVHFIVDVEQELEDQMDVTLEIVSEKAMSQTTSPFLTIGTLTKFIQKLIQERDE